MFAYLHMYLNMSFSFLHSFYFVLCLPVSNLECVKSRRNWNDRAPGIADRYRKEDSVRFVRVAKLCMCVLVSTSSFGAVRVCTRVRRCLYSRFCEWMCECVSGCVSRCMCETAIGCMHVFLALCYFYACSYVYMYVYTHTYICIYI